MKLATWNIYWLGHATKSERTEHDEAVIAKVIDSLSPGPFAADLRQRSTGELFTVVAAT